MSAKLQTANNQLKAALLKLKPTGKDGFEGLIANLLNEITKQDFRLAASGLQLGVDGETLAGLNHISFEGKLYKGDINQNEVLTKITSIIAKPVPPDLWILGATTEAKTQFLGQLQTAATRCGIATLILDWPDASAVPPLAALCAMAPERTHDFLDQRLTDKALARDARTALQVIASDSAFAAASENIAAQLAPASLGMPQALARNAAWLSKTFSDTAQARMELGQRLAPFAAWPLPTQARADLVSTVQGRLNSKPDGKIVALLGGEGVGKSWLFAQTWQASSKPPLTLIVPAADIKPESLNEFDGFLISKIIQQTRDEASDYTSKRWAKRFERWRNLTQPDTPRIVLCVDGLNQHSLFDWPRWLEGAAFKLAELGGTLVVTDRTAHFDDKIKRGLNTGVAPANVPVWQPSEVAAILLDKGIDKATDVTPVSHPAITRVLG